MALFWNILWEVSACQSVFATQRINCSQMWFLLVVASAHAGIVFASPHLEGLQFESTAFRSKLEENEDTPDIMEQFKTPQRAYPRKEHELPSREKAADLVDEGRSNKTFPDEIVDLVRDVVDREDHVTQYLSDMMVNTDSEITSLQVSEYDALQDNQHIRDEVGYFAFLTGQERTFDIEGVQSRPARYI